MNNNLYSSEHLEFSQRCGNARLPVQVFSQFFLRMSIIWIHARLPTRRFHCHHARWHMWRRDYWVWNGEWLLQNPSILQPNPQWGDPLNGRVALCVLGDVKVGHTREPGKPCRCSVWCFSQFHQPSYGRRQTLCCISICAMWIYCHQRPSPSGWQCWKLAQRTQWVVTLLSTGQTKRMWGRHLYCSPLWNERAIPKIH